MTKLILITFGLLFAAPFLYALASFGDMADATTGFKVAVFGVFPLLSVLSLGVAWRGSDDTRANTTLVILSCVFALYVTELLLPVGFQTLAWVRMTSSRSNPIDRRDKVEVVLAARAEGLDAMPAIEPKSLMKYLGDGTFRSRLSDGGIELVALGGVANRHTVVCNEGGSWVTYESDRFGMNNPDAVWDDSVDVATVGDSFTNGWCVDGPRHYANLLRHEYPRTVNLAQAGHGPLLILASIREYLTDREPARVLWFHYEGNDFQDLAAERMSPVLMSYLEDAGLQALPNRQEAIDREVTAYIEAEVDRWRHLGDLSGGRIDLSLSVAAIKSFVKLDEVRTLLGVTNQAAPTADYELLARVLEEAKDRVQSWGGILYFVYLPSSVRYLRTTAAAQYLAARERVLADVSALGLPVIDVPAEFATYDDPLSLYIPIRGGGYGHFTEEGNRIVADVVLEGLRRTADRDADR